MLAPDVEEFLVAYLSPLQPLGSVSIEMPKEPPMPFILINRLSGGDDYVTDTGTVSIHCFSTSRSLAAYEARRMHLMMKSLHPRLSVALSGGVFASADYVEVIETPAWQDYQDNTIWRYCGRYKVDLRLSQNIIPSP